MQRWAETHPRSGTPACFHLHHRDAQEGCGHDNGRHRHFFSDYEVKGLVERAPGPKFLWVVSDKLEAPGSTGTGLQVVPLPSSLTLVLTHDLAVLAALTGGSSVACRTSQRYFRVHRPATLPRAEDQMNPAISEHRARQFSHLQRKGSLFERLLRRGKGQAARDQCRGGRKVERKRRIDLPASFQGQNSQDRHRAGRCRNEILWRPAQQSVGRALRRKAVRAGRERPESWPGLPL